MLKTEQLFKTKKNIRFWLLFPVTFVGVHKMDYPVTGPAKLPNNYHFWFVFVRENSLENKGLYSHVVRICRNDVGSKTNPPIFNTYVKARIFCEKQKPATRDYINTLDFDYNSISEATVYIAVSLTVCPSMYFVCWCVLIFVFVHLLFHTPHSTYFCIDLSL